MPSQQKLATLNEQFAIEGQLQFNATGDLIVADITNQHATASIALQGAQVLSWAAKREAKGGCRKRCQRAATADLAFRRSHVYRG